MTTVDEFLEHFGVLGMHWGVRKDRGGVVKRQSVDSKRTQELKARPVGSLSNKQIQTVNTRLNLEQNFGRLNPTKVAKGKNFAKEALATIGIATAAYGVVTSPAGQAAIKLAKNAIFGGGPKQLRLFG